MLQNYRFLTRFFVSIPATMPRGPFVMKPPRPRCEDLLADSDELNNLVELTGSAGKELVLTNLLKLDMKRYSDSAPLETERPLLGEWSPPQFMVKT